MELYSYNKELRDAVQAVILREKRFQHLKDCRIAVLWTPKDKKSKGRTVYADTKKLNDMQSFMSGYDFVITFYDKSQYLSKAAQDVLIAHELLHIGFEKRGPAERKWIIPHDVEDFETIISEYGVDWTMMGDKEDVMDKTKANN